MSVCLSVEAIQAAGRAKNLPGANQAAVIRALRIRLTLPEYSSHTRGETDLVKHSTSHPQHTHTRFWADACLPPVSSVPYVYGAD